MVIGDSDWHVFRIAVSPGEGMTEKFDSHANAVVNLCQLTDVQSTTPFEVCTYIHAAVRAIQAWHSPTGRDALHWDSHRVFFWT